MKSRYEEMSLWGAEAPQGYTYDYPTIEDDDETIEAFIEAKRKEYYREWHSYVKDFE